MGAWLGFGSILDLPSNHLLNQYARLPQQVLELPAFLEGFVRIPPIFQRVLIQELPSLSPIGCREMSFRYCACITERAGGLRAFSGTTGMLEWGWVEFIDENGGGPGLRLRKRQRAKQPK